jgi:hypothetical protein
MASRVRRRRWAGQRVTEVSGALYGAEKQGSAPERYIQAWFVFIGHDGELSTERDAARISIGVTRAGRVRLVVPEGLDVAPDVAERIAARVAEAALIARNPEARFSPGADDDQLQEGQQQ